MADTNKLKAAKRSGSALDKAMAGLLAGAVAFVALTIPSNLFAGLLGTDGIAARAGAAVLSGLVTYLLVAALLRALGKPARPKGAAKPAEAAGELPRLRRADAHPDAPARSPILAGRELGVPLDEMAIEERPTADLAEVENVDFEAEWERPLPGFIDEEAARAEPAEWEPIDDMLDPSAFTTAVAPEPEQIASDHVEPAAAEPDLVAPEPTHVSSDIPFWVPSGIAPVEAAEPEAPVAEPETQVAPAEPEPPMAVPFRKPRRARPEPTASVTELAERLPETRATDESTDKLFNRLERGLSRRADSGAQRDGADAELDQRLRSALGDLKKMSGRR